MGIIAEDDLISSRDEGNVYTKFSEEIQEVRLVAIPIEVSLCTLSFFANTSFNVLLNPEMRSYVLKSEYYLEIKIFKIYF